MREDFELFVKALCEATRRMKDPHYFKLDVAGREDSIFRERVYCYELYHQLRSVLGDYFTYKLDGEVDKRLHPEIPGDKIPDLIVHVPGEMKRNLAVIEVKSIEGAQRNDMEELREDLKKLRLFLIEGKYHCAIMLIYGDGTRELPKAIVSEVIRYSRQYHKRILLAWHGGCGWDIEII